MEDRMARESMMAATVIERARQRGEGINVEDAEKFLNAFVCDEDTKEILTWLLDQAKKEEA